jgi:hypothetical protein
MVNRRCNPAARFISASALVVTLGTEAVLGLMYSLLQAGSNKLLPANNNHAVDFIWNDFMCLIFCGYKLVRNVSW